MKIVCDPGRNMLGTALTVLAMTVITPIFANDGLDADTAGDQQQMPGDIEEILVTARRREQNAQDIPISLYALAGKDLATFGIQSLEDIRDLVAGVEIIGGSPGAMEVSVRGVSNLNGGRTAAIGYYLDEAPLSSFDGKLLPDIALWTLSGLNFSVGPRERCSERAPWVAPYGSLPTNPITSHFMVNLKAVP
jgi:outer membrane receptor protein involved in Fe transport